MTNNFEGGTSGVAITAGNSGGGSGSAFDSVGSTGFKYDSASAFQGSMGAVVAGGVGGYGSWLFSSTKCSAKMYFKPDATATSDTHLMRIHSGGTRVFSVHLVGSGVNSGKLRVDDASGTGGVNTFATACGNGTYYRLEAYVVAGSTATNGTIKVAYYLGNSTTPLDTVYVNNAANVGTGLTLDQVIEGKYSASAEQIHFDAFAYDTSLSDFIGVSSGPPPTVTISANWNAAPGTYITPSVTASSSSSTIASYAWSYVYPASGGPTLTGATTNTVSLTTGSAGDLYVLQCVVTDANGQSTTATTEVRVPTSGDATVLPGAPTANVGSWANVGGAATPGDAMSDSSDTTFIESAVLTSTETSERFRLQPMTARSTFNLTVRLETDTSGSTSPKVRLFEGTTQRQQWSQAITNSWGDYVLAFTPSTISDWGNLYVEFAATSP
ncbi:PKD domain-containing protein [Leifsonia sp. Leaf336]|uniref:PKD domain-containing protein n=1 Tax=Leifsonia sp. Leaf336 TaxID=1736341 RepID=UPI003FA5505D